jgi:hypothetical protein
MFYWYKEGDTINTTGFYFTICLTNTQQGFELYIEVLKQFICGIFVIQNMLKNSLTNILKMNIAQMNEDYNSIVKSYHKSNSN